MEKTSGSRSYEIYVGANNYMTYINNLVTEPAEKVLLMTRVLDAPRKLVYDACTKREHMFLWGCPKDYTLISCEMDVRVGGAWRNCMRSPEGKDSWSHGFYKELIEPEKIVFTHAWEYPDKAGRETLITIILEEVDSKTNLTFHQAFMFDVADRDNHMFGWGQCFDKLEKFVIKLKK